MTSPNDSRGRADIKPGKEKLFQADIAKHESPAEKEFKDDASQRKYSKESSRK